MTWPLSAPSTALLLDLGTSKGELLRLGVRHLVLCGSWRARTGVARPKRTLQRQQPTPLLLTPGSLPAPPPLRALDGSLRAASPDGGPASEVVGAAVRADHALAKGVRAAARDELAAAGLLTADRRLLGTRWRLTDAGHHERAVVEVRLQRLGDEPSVDDLGLVLQADRPLQERLDTEVSRGRRRPDGGGDGVAVTWSVDGDACTLQELCAEGFGVGDGGGSGGGFGGDGGGDGGGGGGGD